MTAARRPARESEVRARVSADLKRDVRAIALMKGDDENESVVVREAIVWYLRRPDVAPLLQEGRKRLDELERGSGGR